MGEFKLSRIRFKWTGVWEAGRDYAKDDIVEYGGKVYTCIKKHTSRDDFFQDLLNEDGTTIPVSPDPFWKITIDGRVWKGDWTPATDYNDGDIVKYNGIVYICTLEHTSTLTLETDAEYWRIHAYADKWKGDWQPTTFYSENDVVKYGGILYRCITAHQSQNESSGLESSLLLWEIVQKGQDWQNGWQPDTRYQQNDVVKYGGIVYRCVEGHTSAQDNSEGLEADQSKWEIVLENVEYKGEWIPEIPEVAEGFRYKRNDIVKYGASLWISGEGHTSTDEFDETKWTIWIPGFEFDNDWSPTIVYQKGDVVRYGGYLYTSLANSLNEVPSLQSEDSTIGKWRLLNYGFRVVPGGDYQSGLSYVVGDVVRKGGQVYVAISDTSVDPNDDPSAWELVIPGERYSSAWLNEAEYSIGDVVLYQGTSYRSLKKHTSNLNSRPDNDYDRQFWAVYIQGDEFNRLQYPGDIKIYGQTEDGSTFGTTRLPIGDQGQVLTVGSNNEPSWETFGEGTKVFYVGTDGLDDPDRGNTYETPWRTVKYASEQVTGPATIFVKVGTYFERLPIKVPRNVAIVGEELRSTVIEPLVDLDNTILDVDGNPVADPLDFRAVDMFHVNDGTGIRNLTLRGKEGVLGPVNEFLTRRPTGGSYVSLDPGTGPDDESVWIINRSCYVQNVTTFGFACTGLKVDGSLHDGGNRSIVANDFTQVISDGIGAWVTNKGLSELVSVFSYYGHIGYLAENGGKIRATNGNSSYGTYGCVAEGVDVDESPISGVINNRNQEAVIDQAFIGESGNEILRFEFEHAGENYTTASYTVVGSGTGVEVEADEFRDGAVFNIRVLSPEDSTALVGGSGFISVGNNAQGGDSTGITIASNDENDITIYGGCRIIITSGTGVGQYGFITEYNIVNKRISVSDEATGLPGWGHINPGTPIEPILDTTTVYRIEPRVTFTPPSYSAEAGAIQASDNWTDIIYADGAYVGVGVNGTVFKLDGEVESATQLPISIERVRYGDGKFVAIGDGDQIGVSLNGSTWTSANKPQTAINTGLDYGRDKWISVISTGDSAIFSFDADDWYETTLPFSGTWSSLVYGKGKFVAIDSSSNNIAYTDGISVIDTDAVETALTEIANTGTATSSVLDTFLKEVVGGFARGDIDNSGSIDGADVTAFQTWALTQTGNNWILNNIKTPIESNPETLVDGTKLIWNSTSVQSLGDSSEPTWTDIAYGNNRFVAIARDSSLFMYSFDGITWTLGNLPYDATWEKIAYGQGAFMIVPSALDSSATDKILVSDGGYYWQERTLSTAVSRTAVAFGNKNAAGEWLILPADGQAIQRVKFGATTKGRVVTDGGSFQKMRLWEPGSGYTESPTFTLTDPNATSQPNTQNRVGNGVLANPSFLSRGNGYRSSTTTVTVAGDGYAEIFPTGRNLFVNNLNRIPRTGANLVLDRFVWSELSVPVNTTWSDIAFGGGNWVAVGSGLNGLHSSDGLVWNSTVLSEDGEFSAVAYGNDTFIAVVNGSNAVGRSTDGINWTTIILPESINATDIAFGNGTFVIVQSGSASAYYSTDDGLTWQSSNLPQSATWTSIAFGDSTFIAVAEGGALAAESSNGISWSDLDLGVTADWAKIVFGNGRFVIVALGSDKTVVSDDRGESWAEGTLPAEANWNKLKFANNRYLAFSSNSIDFATSTDGLVWKARSQPVDGVQALGVGDTKIITLKGTQLVYAGDGTEEEVYRVLTIQNITGSNSNFNAVLRVAPEFNRDTTPNHGLDIEIRERYSQVRLTGHDFLEIGTGNFEQTNYPNIDLRNLAPFNETQARGGGRVFYTSTDQDGNFRVGELFAVEQATGVVTISADFFDLGGLSELRLGGIRVGGTGVVIREFSTDATFSADSNNVVPTQRAIKAFIERRISGGGSNAATGRLIAGTVGFGPDQIFSSINGTIDIPVKVNMLKGASGMLLAQSFFTESFNSGLDYQEVGRDLA